MTWNPDLLISQNVMKAEIMITAYSASFFFYFYSFSQSASNLLLVKMLSFY